jgi:1-acyl-sn-glycerol-3-phosphate acyltransferase
MFYNVCLAIVRAFMKLLFRIEINGEENIPQNDGALICPNHYSNWDPLLVAVCLPRRIRFMAKHQLFKNPILRFVLLKLGMYPVRRGEADLNAIKTTLKILKDNGLVGLFPEGTRIKGGQLGKANAGVAMLSIKSGKSVIPVCISGKYKPFSKLRVIFGQPIDFTKYKKDKMTNDDFLELSQIVMERIRELKKEEI